MQTTGPASGGMIVREVDGELLILDTASNHIHQLNETASIVWRMRRDGATPQAIAAILAADFAVDEAQAILAADFAVDEAQALADVHTTLQRLDSLNLLDERESTSMHPLA